MIIEDVKIADIKPYERNQKKHPESQVKNIAKSIEKYGFVQPIVIDKNNEIIIGHGRYMAGGDILGMKTVPCVRAENLTEDEIRELRIIDNKLNESDWDMDLLKDDLEDLDFDDFDIDWGIEEDDDMSNITEDEPVEIDEEAEPIAKRGDIYILGEHRLMCGDSTSRDDVQKLMNGEKADLLLTDPPYGIDYGGMLKGKGDGKGGADKNGWKSYNAPEWDKQRPEKAFFEYAITAAKECIIWGGNYFADILPAKMCWLVWDKGQRDFSLADGELAWTSFDKALRIKTYSRASANQEDKVHPTQKPIELLRWCIEDIAERNMDGVKNILDLFGGSGSTLIACEQLERRCFMMELEPHYVDVIIQRWETFTGKKAEKIEKEE